MSAITPLWLPSPVRPRFGEWWRRKRRFLDGLLHPMAAGDVQVGAAGQWKLNTAGQLALACISQVTVTFSGVTTCTTCLNDGSFFEGRATGSINGTHCVPATGATTWILDLPTGTAAIKSGTIGASGCLTNTTVVRIQVTNAVVGGLRIQVGQGGSNSWFQYHIPGGTQWDQSPLSGLANQVPASCAYNRFGHSGTVAISYGC
jgi:hypothetical protein